MVDMLVLARAERFTGWAASTLGWYVRETRCQRGIPAETTNYVGTAGAMLTACLHITNFTEVCPPSAQTLEAVSSA